MSNVIDSLCGCGTPREDSSCDDEDEQSRLVRSSRRANLDEDESGHSSSESGDVEQHQSSWDEQEEQPK